MVSMKRILLVSDNHMDNDILFDVYNQHCADVDYCIHCGDSMMDYAMMHSFFLCVRGNNDDFDYPLEKIITIENRKILIIHGTRLADYAKQTRLIAYARNKGVDTVFYGHTHIPSVIHNGNMVLINPGSLRYNRDGSKRSYCIVSIDGSTITPQFFTIE